MSILRHRADQPTTPRGESMPSYRLQDLIPSNLDSRLRRAAERIFEVTLADTDQEIERLELA